MSSSASTPPAPPASTPSTTDSPPSFGTAAPAPKASGYLSNDPSRTGFDPKTQWWVNYFNILTGRVTPEGIHHYREWRYAENEARDCKRCEEQVQWVFKHSPIVRFMAERVNELNGDISPKNVYCRRCPASVDPKTGRVGRMEAGFNIDSGILICANEVQGKKRTEDVLAHEMVHAYDHLRWKSDINGNMKHAACTEVGSHSSRALLTFALLTLFVYTDPGSHAQRGM